MSQFLLPHMEGVNLVNVIDDTDDLSTRRGGGLMILGPFPAIPRNAPKGNARQVDTHRDPPLVGLFSFEAAQ